MIRTLVFSVGVCPSNGSRWRKLPIEVARCQIGSSRVPSNFGAWSSRIASVDRSGPCAPICLSFWAFGWDCAWRTTTDEQIRDTRNKQVRMFETPSADIPIPLFRAAELQQRQQQGLQSVLEPSS